MHKPKQIRINIPNLIFFRGVLLLCIIICTSALYAQTKVANGEICGKVSGSRKEPLSSATVHIYKDAFLKADVTTDFDGDYAIKQLEPGKYRLAIIYSGYDTAKYEQIVVYPNRQTIIDCKMNGHLLVVRTRGRQPLESLVKPPRVLFVTEMDTTAVPARLYKKPKIHHRK